MDLTADILEGFLSSGSLPHAFLFLGSDGGSGADSIVETFAQKISDQKFPNIDTVQFDAAEGTGIEGIRQVLQLAALLPVVSNYKIVVLRNMDAANTAMLNALLKNLEEPPTHTIFLLQSARPLLATVMSRCQVLNLGKSVLAESPELAEAAAMLEKNRSAGLAEKLSLVTTLADLKDELLPQLIEYWLQKQTAELSSHPENYKSVRITMETLQALRGNFNKKMVLQNFVMSGL